MISPFYFIVEPVGGKSYDNVRDNGLIVSSSKEDHKATNRFAIVINVPMGYNGPVKIGDTVVVHHNVFRSYFDMKGREKKSFSYIINNTYYLEMDQFYLFKSDGGEWQANPPYCFVRPLKKEQISELKEIGIEEALVGEIAYSNSFDKKTLVSFQPDSEYEFKVDGEKLYRMFDKNICILL